MIKPKEDPTIVIVGSPDNPNIFTVEEYEMLMQYLKKTKQYGKINMSRRLDDRVRDNLLKEAKKFREAQHSSNKGVINTIFRHD